MGWSKRWTPVAVKQYLEGPIWCTPLDMSEVTKVVLRSKRGRTRIVTERGSWTLEELTARGGA